MNFYQNQRARERAQKQRLRAQQTAREGRAAAQQAAADAANARLERQRSALNAPAPDFRDAAAEERLDALYRGLSDREPFRYRAWEDPLYRQERDRYLQDGRLAMRDSMGKAAALTGGYGSSYGQIAGQQQYGEYLRRLSEVMPRYYSLAWEQYQAQGEAQRQAYDLAREREDAEIRRRENAWTLARKQAESEYQRAYQQQRDRLADQRYAQEAAEKARAQTLKERQSSYTALVALISGSGYTPTDAELSLAGLSRAAAESLRQEYLRKNGLTAAVSGASGSGGGRGGSGGKSAAGPKTVSIDKTSKRYGDSGATSGASAGKTNKRASSGVGSAASAAAAGAVAGASAVTNRRRGNGGR